VKIKQVVDVQHPDEMERYQVTRQKQCQQACKEEGDYIGR